MTVRDFKKILKAPNHFMDMIDYGLCLTLIVIGLYFIQTFDSLLYAIPCGLVFILAGVYGFWRIPENYIVNRYASDLSRDKKIELIEQYLKTKKGFNYSVADDIIYYHYTGSFFADVYLVLYADDSQLLVNVNGLGTPRGTGFMDFGLTFRARKRLQLYLNEKL